jgi:hypothetical protein
MVMSNLKRIPLLFLGCLALAMVPESSQAGGPGRTADGSHHRVDPVTVQRYGAGYRYPQAGWIVLHIEGDPYERGYQHGRLMAPEIGRFIPELARYRSTRAPADAWKDLRLLADALFLRRFDAEYREEMKGIADGAAAAGVTFDGRPVDFLDIVTINADIETNFLENAMEATATGLEGRRFREPAEQGPTRPKESHCSAFAATGPATADGQVVIGHITMWNLFHAYHYNVWLDVKPTKGHRVLMQTYPGGIMSGLDYYLNDHGLVVCETTLAQTKFDDSGIPLVDRIRRALQYGESIDDAVRILKQGNNGLYTNEWILADTKINEIAMFELGTHQSHLWRSSRNEWFGGTTGFYWGCNNAKDLNVRLETAPSTAGRPFNVVFHPSDRDRTWLQLFDRKNKTINVDFGFQAFTTPPLAASHSLDAKFTTTAMVRELSTWAKFGPPLGSTWEPTDAERGRFPGMHPLIANDWTVLRADPPAADPPQGVKPVDLARTRSRADDAHEGSRELAPAWHGTILPKTDADTWLSAAFAEYERIVAEEHALQAPAHGGSLSARAREQIAVSLFAPISRYLAAVARRGGSDLPLSETRADLRSDEWYDIASGKGVLVLAELRTVMGDGPFESFMDEFGRTHAGSAVETTEFFQAAEKSHGKPISSLTESWLNGQGSTRLGAEVKRRHETRRFWSVDSFERQLEKALIVYGTVAEADVQREAAQRLQRKLAGRWANITIPIKADTEVSDPMLKDAHILLVGRPSTNRLTARLVEALPVRFSSASVTVADETFAHPHTALVAAGPSPMAADRSVVVFAGLSAEGTWECARRFPDRGGATAEVLLMETDAPHRRLAVPAASARHDHVTSGTTPKAE